MGTSVAPTKPHISLQDEMMRVAAGRVNTVYESWEASVGIVSNVALSAQSSGALFVIVPVAHHLIIRVNQPGVTIRLNSPTGPVISLDPGIPFENRWVQITEVYVSTTQPATFMRVILS